MKALLVSVFVFGTTTAFAEAADKNPIETCDRLAGDRHDPDLPRDILKIEDHEIEAERAEPACRLALASLTAKSDGGTSTTEATPGAQEASRIIERRVQYQLGRALAKMDRRQEAIQLIEKAAAAGSSAAVIMRCLADAFPANGQPDMAAVRRCYETAAAAGSAEGMRLMGRFHEIADGAERDPAASLRWYEKAAEAGSSGAMLALGTKYADGDDVAQNTVLARTWLEKAALAGETEAMEKLADTYDDDTDKAEDMAVARRWYEKAASVGSTSAMHILGLMAAYGNDGPADFDRARGWYEKGALAGSPHMMNTLGVIYEAGAGVPRDLAAARAWFEKAAAAGNEDAENHLAILTGTSLPFGGVVLVRKKDAAEYGAPAARSCTSKSLSPAGPTGAARAAAYVICGKEYDNGTELTLVSNVRVTLGEPRPFNPGQGDTFYRDVVASAPVYDVRGSLTEFVCEKRTSQTGSMNCRRKEMRNLTGLCAFGASMEWDCSTNYDSSAPYVSRNNSAPPAEMD